MVGHGGRITHFLLKSAFEFHPGFNDFILFFVGFHQNDSLVVDLLTVDYIL